VDKSEFPTYSAWRERYAPPIIRMRGMLVAAVDQATRYGRQAAQLNVPEHEADLSRVIDAWLAFLGQFSGTTRDVVSRTFWYAYNS
jgi:hypothetical protein